MKLARRLPLLVLATLLALPALAAPAIATVTAKGSDGSLVASTLLVGAAEAVELRGALTAVDTGAGTLTLLGLTVKTDAHTVFTGSTARGTVHALADLAPGDNVSVEAVRSGADLVAQHVNAEPATPPGGGSSEFHGRVEAIGADAWTISGRTVKITSTTKISGSPAVGDTVSVKGTVASDGTFTALSIEKEGRGGTTNLQEIHGTLQAKAADSWTISGTVVKITSTTVIRNDPKVGDRVGGVARKESDGSLTGLVLFGIGDMGSGGSDD